VGMHRPTGEKLTLKKVLRGRGGGGGGMDLSSTVTGGGHLSTR